MKTEEVVSWIRPLVSSNGLGKFVEVFDAGGGVVEIGEEVEVTLVGGGEEVFEVGVKAVDGLFEWGELETGSSVAMFHRAVVREKGDVVGGGFNAQDDAEFVVEFERSGSHVVFDARAFDAGVEMVADLALIMAVKFSSQESGDLISFDGVDGGADNGFVESSEILGAFKEEVRGIFDLHEAPVIRGLEFPGDGTVEQGGAIEDAVKRLNAELIGQALSGRKIVTAGEGVVRELMGDARLGQFGRQPVVAVEVELKTEGTPGGNAQITKAENRIHEVEVIVEALPKIRFQESFVSCFVVPGFVGGAGFHGGEDMDQTRMSSTAVENFLDAVFLAETIDPPNKFDGQSCFLSESFGVGSNSISKRFGEERIVKDTDVVSAQVRRHPIRVTESGKRALDHDSVPTGENSSDTIFVAFDECHRYLLADREYHDAEKKSSCLVPATPG